MKITDKNSIILEEYRDNQDRLHRIDGPALVYKTGEKFWYIYGVHHRVGGPATERPNGDCYWLQYGLLHRTDGPAVTSGNGNCESYYYKGDPITKEEFYSPEFQIKIVMEG